MARGDGDTVDAAILEALRDRGREGMTIFELRSQVAADIDSIEASLERIKRAGLIEADHSGSRVIIMPTEAALTMEEPTEEDTWFDRIRERLPL